MVNYVWHISITSLVRQFSAILRLGMTHYERIMTYDDDDDV